jgi:hypothetical protein
MLEPRLLTRLEDVGSHLALPDVDFVDAVTARLREAPRPARPSRVRARPVIAVALAVAVVVAVVVAVPPTRRAVARWLGIGSVHVEQVPTLPSGLGASLRLGNTVTLDAATRAMPFPVKAPAALGSPAKVYIGLPTKDSVSLVWVAGDKLPAAEPTGVGALLSEYGGTIDRTLVEKNVAPGTRIEDVTVAGHEAYWITGAAHSFFYMDRNGVPLPDSTRLAGNTLLWVDDGVTFRFESGLDRDRALALAERLVVL